PSVLRKFSFLRRDTIRADLKAVSLKTLKHTFTNQYRHTHTENTHTDKHTHTHTLTHTQTYMSLLTYSLQPLCVLRDLCVCQEISGFDWERREIQLECLINLAVSR